MENEDEIATVDLEVERNQDLNSLYDLPITYPDMTFGDIRCNGLLISIVIHGACQLLCRKKIYDDIQAHESLKYKEDSIGSLVSTWLTNSQRK